MHLEGQGLSGIRVERPISELKSTFVVKAEVVDIFSSIQGEGIFLGARQVFIRFKRCNLTCKFCDEPRNMKGIEYSSSELMREIKFLQSSKGPHHSISLTGGEPLLYSDFLNIFLKDLKRENFKTYLETNGTLPDGLSNIIDLIDIVSMDFKLPSSTGERPFWKEHFEFLKIAAKKKVFVKAIVTTNTVKKDIEKAIALIKTLNKNIPLILQPATPVNRQDRAVNKDILLKFLEIGARNNLNNIRVIPQMHKVLNLK